MSCIRSIDLNACELLNTQSLYTYIITFKPYHHTHLVHSFLYINLLQSNKDVLELSVSLMYKNIPYQFNLQHELNSIRSSSVFVY